MDIASSEKVDPTRAVVDRMRAAASVKERADIAGLARAPVVEDDLEKSCETCIYFLARRCWCDLPELNIPVDADWYCKLWRV